MIEENKKVVLVDMDNTLNMFWITYIDYINMIEGTNIQFERDDLRSYELSHCLEEYGITPARGEVLREKIFNYKAFWRDLPIFPYAAPVMNKLCKAYDVYIVTLPWYGLPSCFELKRRWVFSHLPRFDLNRIIFTGQKHLINCDIIIEDKEDYLINTTATTTIAMDFPYNRHIDVDFRAKGWQDVEGFLNL